MLVSSGSSIWGVFRSSTIDNLSALYTTYSIATLDHLRSTVGSDAISLVRGKIADVVRSNPALGVYSIFEVSYLYVYIYIYRNDAILCLC